MLVHVKSLEHLRERPAHARATDRSPSCSGTSSPACSTTAPRWPSTPATSAACARCASGGLRHLCFDNPILGVGLDGGLAERVLVRPDALVRLPAGVPVEHACLVEPIAVSIHGMAVGGIVGGERVAVVGAGSIGLTAVAAAAVEPVRRRRSRRATTRSATPVSGSGARGPAEGEYDVVFEAAGTQSAVDRALDLVRPGGTVVFLSTLWDPVAIPGVAAMMKEATLKWAFTYAQHGGGRDLDTAAALLARRPEIAETLITPPPPARRRTRRVPHRTHRRRDHAAAAGCASRVRWWHAGIVQRDRPRAHREARARHRRGHRDRARHRALARERGLRRDDRRQGCRRARRRSARDRERGNPSRPRDRRPARPRQRARDGRGRGRGPRWPRRRREQRRLARRSADHTVPRGRRRLPARHRRAEPVRHHVVLPGRGRGDGRGRHRGRDRERELGRVVAALPSTSRRTARRRPRSTTSRARSRSSWRRAASASWPSPPAPRSRRW